MNEKDKRLTSGMCHADFIEYVGVIGRENGNNKIGTDHFR